jgi:tetratricopeptide (TPR) repeat protein
MDCTDCEAILDELLRGGLPARREAEVRSHLARCPRCRASHMRRLRAAETAGPSARKRPRWRLMALLPRALRPKPRVVGKDSAANSRLGVFGRLITGPQVSMGTVMLLIVLVGLWAVPQLSRRRAPHFGSEVGDVTKDTRETEASSALSPTPSSPDASSAFDAPAVAASSAIHVDPYPRNDIEAALVHYHAGEYAEATPLFSRALISAAGDADQAQALLYLARAERALGHCDRAVNSYATLVRVHPGRTEAQAALREGVACYDRMAEHAHAQHLLQQAANSPELAGDARSLLAQRGNARKPTTTKHTGTAPRPD